MTSKIQARFAILALTGLLLLSGCINPPGGNEALTKCKQTYGQEDMTHRLRVTYHENKWNCELVLLSCEKDGTNCYTIEIKPIEGENK